MTKLILQLLLAHLIGDFILQPNRWVQDKNFRKEKSIYLYLHLLVHVAVLLVLLEFEVKTYWLGILTIVFSHFLIDLTKLHLSQRYHSRILFWVDQLAHLLVIGAVVYWYEPFDFTVNAVYTEENLLLITAVLLVTGVSAIVMKVIMSKWQYKVDTRGSLPEAGKYIGMLERIFVFTFVVLGQWQGIGFLIAAKSVFRFSDLSKAKNKKLTEYILVGTLLSFALAIAVGLLYNHIKVLL